MGTVYSLLTTSTLLAGCTPGRVDLINSGELWLAKISDKQGHYRYVHAYQTDNGLLVIGYVRRSSWPAHVHISVVDSGGQAIVNTTTEVRRVSRSLRVWHVQFEALIPLEPTDGFVLTVRHHIEQLEESKRGDSIEPTQLEGH